MQEISIEEIARVVGVSKSTVSRTLNNSGYVSSKTRDKVEQAVGTLGFRRNLTAKNLRSKSSNFVGLIVPDISNEFFSQLACSLETSLRKEGFALFLCNTEERVDIENFYIDSLLDNQVQALVLSSAADRLNDKIKMTKLPVVLADRFFADESYDSLCCVMSDNEMGGRLAVEMLAARGASRLLILSDERHIRGTEKRAMSARAAARSLGIACEIIYGPVSMNGGYDTLRRALRASTRFDALFCTTDSIAFGALRALVEAGKRIPEEIQVVGFDGTEFSAFTNPPLTTFRQDVNCLGQAAARAVVDMIHKRPVARLSQFSVELIERASTRAISPHSKTS